MLLTFINSDIAAEPRPQFRRVLLSPHHALDLVAEEHVAQHQAAHHGLGLGKLG